jgi:hypothetical protein
MEIIIHRVNTIRELKRIEKNCGAEIDIRAWDSDLILNHKPFKNGEKLIDYLDEYNNGTLILNIKENGIENEVLRLVGERQQIKSYFLLDVEFPYLFSASKRGEKNMAIRFSEHESIETVKKYIGMVDWVWIDTNTLMPVDETNIPVLNEFKKCLVCPERWGRPDFIKGYKQKLSSIGFELDGVMTSINNIMNWRN